MPRPNRVKELRLSMGLTQPQLAKLIGVSKSTISDIERHKKNINSREYEALVAVFGLASREGIYRED